MCRAQRPERICRRPAEGLAVELVGMTAADQQQVVEGLAVGRLQWQHVAETAADHATLQRVPDQPAGGSID